MYHLRGTELKRAERVPSFKAKTSRFAALVNDARRCNVLPVIEQPLHMSNLLEQAIRSDDGDRAAQLIQDALGIKIRRRRQLPRGTAVEAPMRHRRFVSFAARAAFVTVRVFIA